MCNTLFTCVRFTISAPPIELRSTREDVQLVVLYSVAWDLFGLMHNLLLTAFL
jgi:hypothetical protein